MSGPINPYVYFSKETEDLTGVERSEYEQEQIKFHRLIEDSVEAPTAAKCHEIGKKCIERNRESEAVEWLEKGFALGSIESHDALKYRVDRETYPKENFDRIYKEYFSKAQNKELDEWLERAKNPASGNCSIVARFYEKAGLEKEALIWREKAARRGHVESFKEIKKKRDPFFLKTFSSIEGDFKKEFDKELIEEIKNTESNPKAINFWFVANKYQETDREEEALKWHEKAARLGHALSFKFIEKQKETFKDSFESIRHDYLSAGVQGNAMELKSAIETVTKDPQDPYNHWHLAIIYNKMEMAKEALESHERAARLGNDLSMREIKENQKAFRESLSSIEADYLLARSKRIEKQIQEAVESKTIWKYKKLATDLTKYGMHEQALEWYVKAALLGDDESFRMVQEKQHLFKDPSEYASIEKEFLENNEKRK